MASRTRVTSMFRYSAMPPETPESIRWSRERRRVLPDRLENGALEFVMCPLSCLGPLHHIRIGTDLTLARPRHPRAGGPDDFRRTVGGGVYRRGMDVEALPKVVLGLPGVEEDEGWAGQPVLKVRSRSFAYLSEDGTRLLLKALREEQEALVAEDPEVYSPSWASGRFAWLEIDIAAADDQELRELVTEAWRLTAPK